MAYRCNHCNKTWYHAVDMCVFCGSKLDLILAKNYHVKDITKVYIPSYEHNNIPYYIMILEDEFGNTYIKKTLIEQDKGASIRMDNSDSFQPAVIGIVGTGTMGKELAQYFLEFGNTIVVKSRSLGSLNNAIKYIDQRLSKKYNQIERKSILNRAILTTDMQDLMEADLIIENLVENIEIKKQSLEDLSQICSEKTIISTNTSSISIDDLAEAVHHPERFLGTHFFNPVSKMHLVELIRGAHTSDRTMSSMYHFLENIGKTPIITIDSPGFIVNRTLMPLINEASYLVQEGANCADVDRAIKLGLNHPMGPLELADLIGLDICVSIMNVIHEKIGDDKYLPSPLLIDMVKAGSLGKKTKKGFFNY